MTPGLSFGHNLSFKYPNGSCKPILNIYVPRAFQWYNEIFNTMNFDLCNHPLKIWDSNSQTGSSLGSVGVHSLTLSYTFGSMKYDSRAHSWTAPLQALALVTSPRLGLRHLLFWFATTLAKDFSSNCIIKSGPRNHYLNVSEFFCSTVTKITISNPCETYRKICLKMPNKMNFRFAMSSVLV